AKGLSGEPMLNPIVNQVANEMAIFNDVPGKAPHLFPNGLNSYPIPFFGDIRRAEIVTVALNPAQNEFETGRQWPTNLDATSLTTRLLHYFDLPEPEPHPWFGDLEKALLYIECSYWRNSVHVDLLSFPTK